MVRAMKEAQLAFVGAGNMATSLIGGLIADGYPAGCIRAADPVAEQRDRLHRRHGIQVSDDNTAVVAAADVVILAVKPQVMAEVARGLAEAVARRRPLVISIAAGIRTGDLDRWLGGAADIVRAMPNTPALVQSGATALYAGNGVDADRRDQAESILRAVGLVVWIDDEALMDAVTALSGSGPAYFFLLMELLSEIGADLGLPADAARLLTLQTAFGAAKMALESSEDAAALRRRVTSPGGTTEAALAVLEDGNLRALLHRALDAARDRSRELAEELGRP